MMLTRAFWIGARSPRRGLISKSGAGCASDWLISYSVCLPDPAGGECAAHEHLAIDFEGVVAVAVVDPEIAAQHIRLLVENVGRCYRPDCMIEPLLVW